jgi:2-methylcitrate dehydratase PrpD
MSMTVSERLVAFLQEWSAKGAPDNVLHEAKRLLLNQLKASVGAVDNPAIKTIHDWVADEGAAKPEAHVLWLGTAVTPAQAAMVNGALFEVLDFHDTYVPTFLHAVSGVLPAVLAAAETKGASGRQLLTALALGIEAELAVATILMPTGYYRGYVPAGLVGGVGAAAACSVLAGLDSERMRNALGIAMCTAFGTYESVGSMTLSYITGATARSGLTAFQLAERGMTAPATAFEGEKAMFVTHCDENPEKVEGVLASLGSTWRIFGNSYKTMPTETITHAPIECTLALLARANGRAVERMRFKVQPIVVKIADERRDRFGNPSSDQQARFDLRYCAAAAWRRGRFTLEEMQEPAYTDAAILDLRARTDLLPDEARTTFNGAALEITFTDGSTEFVNIDFFLGTPERPMSDSELADLFRKTADAHLPAGKADRILDAIWGLDSAPDIHGLMALLTH